MRKPSFILQPNLFMCVCVHAHVCASVIIIRNTIYKYKKLVNENICTVNRVFSRKCVFLWSFFIRHKILPGASRTTLNSSELPPITSNTTIAFYSDGFKFAAP